MALAPVESPPAPISRAELLGCRLFTGPMGTKYMNALRSCAAHHDGKGVGALSTCSLKVSRARMAGSTTSGPSFPSALTSRSHTRFTRLYAGSDLEKTIVNSS